MEYRTKNKEPKCTYMQLDILIFQFLKSKTIEKFIKIQMNKDKL